MAELLVEVEFTASSGTHWSSSGGNDTFVVRFARVEDLDAAIMELADARDRLVAPPRPSARQEG